MEKNIYCLLAFNFFLYQPYEVRLIIPLLQMTIQYNRYKVYTPLLSNSSIY